MQESPNRTTRRSTLKLFAAVAGVVTMWRPGLAAGAVRSQRSPAPPSYVPAAFHFRRRLDGLTDGFGGTSDVTYVYVNQSVPLANAFPLLVCASSDPRRALGGTAPKPGFHVTLVRSDGQTVPGRYHEGIWWIEDDGRIVWNRHDVHSLTIIRDGTTYGIRGARSAGVTFDELQKVALSLV